MKNKKTAHFDRRNFLAALGATGAVAGLRLPARAAEEKKLNFYN